MIEANTLFFSVQKKIKKEEWEEAVQDCRKALGNKITYQSPLVQQFETGMKKQ